MPLLVAVIDINPAFVDGDQFQSCIESLCTYFKAYQMMHMANRVEFIFPSLFGTGNDQNTLQHQYQTLTTNLNGSVISQRVLPLDLVEIQNRFLHQYELSLNSYAQTRGISSALGRALCFINRRSHALNGGIPHVQVRNYNMQSDFDVGGYQQIFVFSTSPDIKSEYIPLMNTVFTCQRMGIKVNVCRFNTLTSEQSIASGAEMGSSNSKANHKCQSSVFMQQVAHITHGVYIDVDQKSTLTSALLSAFIVSGKVDSGLYQGNTLNTNVTSEGALTSYVVVPCPSKVDLRATCFCHGDIVDMAYVCSVCLAVYCDLSNQCKTCGTHYGRVDR
ncbi:hypothetical protein MIR68_006498 [Amoeboaphelidium protococcarum]|nr:hypothetical protein MIR68_006498 [Amoeboaphelidium protococcarum]